MAEQPRPTTPTDAAAEMLRRKRCQTSLHSFAMNIGIPGAPMDALKPDEDLVGPARDLMADHHALICDKLEETMNTPYGRLMIFLPPGAAKALALDTPIPVPDGWTTMEQLRVGDKVFDERGVPCSVVAKSEVFSGRPCFTLRTDCGDTVVADEEHEWRVRLCGKPRQPLKVKNHHLARPDRADPASQFKIKTTGELCRRRAKRPMIERAQALVLPQRELPVDPYTLGVWLGDGHSSSGAVTSHQDDQPHIRRKIEQAGYRTSDRKKGDTFCVLGLRGGLVTLGVLHDPWSKNPVFGHKHIPPDYLRASQTQRLALLQGLVDTDGTVCKERGCTTFCNTSYELANGTRELVRSLGVKAGWSESRAVLYGKDCGPVYKVSFYLENSASLPRKRALTRNQIRTPNTYIDVVPAESVPTQCIVVDSPSHLFLAGRSMTPTHNSSYANVGLAWDMSRPPPPHQQGDKRLIMASYNDTIVSKQSRRVQTMCRDPDYQVWDEPVKIVREAAGEWSLSNGAELMAAGITSGITGNRADGVLIDDPVKNREDADSMQLQQKTVDEYNDSIMTRLKPGAWVVLIQTRWSENDLAGQILPEKYDGRSGKIKCTDGMEWEVINIPAKCERRDDPLGRKPGEYLWTEWFPPQHWQQYENVTTREKRRTWASLYQQRPVPEGAGDFERNDINWFDPGDEPVMLHLYGASDYAVTEAGGDFSEHGVAGIDSANDLWLIDWWSGQVETDKSIEAFLDMAARYQSDANKHQLMMWTNEGGVIDKAVRPAINRAMREANTFVDLRTLPSIKDKRAKCASFIARCSAGTVWLPRVPWAYDLVDQLVAGSQGRHDDKYDVAGLIGRSLDKWTTAAAPSEERKSGIKPFSAQWLEYSEPQTGKAVCYR